MSLSHHGYNVIKGKLVQARISLVKLRGPNYPVDDELVYLQKSYAFTQQNTTSFRSNFSHFHVYFIQRIILENFVKIFKIN